MSVRLMGRVFAESEAEGATRLVLLVLADSAHDDGITWLSQRDIAEKARISEGHSRECVKRLASDGELEVFKVQRGRRRINVYRLRYAVIAIDGDRLPFELPADGPRPQDSCGRQERDDRRSAASTTADPTGFSEGLSISFNRKELTVRNPPLDPPRSTNRPPKVDRRPVTDPEYQAAAAALAAFNEQAGTRYASRDWIAKIVMRVREHPDLPAAAHAEVIRRALAEPWWRGDPSPSVVYGNAALFERCLHAAAASPTGDRALTPEEIRTFGGLWGPGTGFASLVEARLAGARDDEDVIELADEDVIEEP